MPTKALIKKVMLSALETKEINGLIYTAGTHIAPVAGLVYTAFLNGPVAGSAYYMRTGGVIQEAGLTIRGVFQTSSSGATTGDCVRILVYRCLSNNDGVMPTITNLLEPIGGGAGQFPDGEIAPYPYASKKLIKILHDQVVRVDAFIASGTHVTPWSIHLPIKNRIQFTSIVGTYGQCNTFNSGGVGIAFVSGIGGTVSIGCTTTFKWKDV